MWPNSRIWYTSSSGKSASPLLFMNARPTAIVMMESSVKKQLGANKGKSFVLMLCHS